VPSDSENIERREVSRLASSFHIEFRTDPPNEFRAVAFGGKHATQKKQIARLYRFHVGAEWLRGAGSWTPNSFNRCAAPAGPGSPRIISALPFGFVLMFISFSKLALEMRPEWRRLNCNDMDNSGVCHSASMPSARKQAEPECYEAIRPETRGLNNRTLISIILCHWSEGEEAFQCSFKARTRNSR